MYPRQWQEEGHSLVWLGGVGNVSFEMKAEKLKFGGIALFLLLFFAMLFDPGRASIFGFLSFIPRKGRKT
jgi:hypothetical protein